MRWVFVLVLVLFLETVASRLILDYIRYPNLLSSSRNSDTLRGTRRGDIWGPALPGSNELKCGATGNNDPVLDNFGIRAVVQVGEGFAVAGEVLEALPNEDRVLEFQLKYGSNPNFWEGGWFALDTYTMAPAEGFPQTWNYQLNISKAIGYNYEATVQVTFMSAGATYVQCIDIKVVGGLSVPPNKRPDDLGPAISPIYVPPQLQWQVPNVTESPQGSDKITLNETVIGTITVFQLILICLLALLLLLVAILCCCCRGRGGSKDASAEPELADQVLVRNEEHPEDWQLPAAAFSSPSSNRLKSPHGGFSPVNPRIRIEDPPSKSESESQEPEEEDEQANNAAGSRGRQFHFRYL